MATSSQSIPNASERDHFGHGVEDELQAFTLTADWSNVLSATDPSLQLPMGPLDPELAAFDDLFNSCSPQDYSFDLDRERSSHSSASLALTSLGAIVNTKSSCGKSSQTTMPDTIAPQQAMPGNSDKSHRNAKQRHRHSCLASSSDDATPVAKEEDWHVTTKERNRIAASKCRRKKRLEEKDMEEMRRSLELNNAVLQDTAAHLREEVLFLKNEILRHGACDFPPIQNYVLAAASQIHGGYTPDS